MRIRKISFGIVLLALTMAAFFPLKKMDLCTCGNQPINTSLQMNGVFMNTKIVENIDSYEAFVLYKNGYFYRPGYIESINELEKLLAEEAEYIKKNPKIIDKRNSAWGCFSIIDSTIRMQYFYELHGGRFGLMQLNGKILTKNSFVITQHVNHHKKVFVEQDTFLLGPFVKRDSTNWLQKEKCKE